MNLGDIGESVGVGVLHDVGDIGGSVGVGHFNYHI